MMTTALFAAPAAAGEPGEDGVWCDPDQVYLGELVEIPGDVFYEPIPGTGFGLIVLPLKQALALVAEPEDEAGGNLWVWGTLGQLCNFDIPS